MIKACKALHGTSLQYLDELVVVVFSGVTYSKKYFEKDAATLWNNVPANTKKCKALDAFKTNLFISSFPI